MNGMRAIRSSRRLRAALAIAGVAILGASISGVFRTIGERAASPGAGPRTAVGWASAPQPLPEIRFQDGDGKPYTLSDFRGKVVLLNVWATWCAPCRKEMPELAGLQEKLGSDDFEVVAISVDRKGAATSGAFLVDNGAVALKLYVDPSALVLDKLKAIGLPASYLIDRQGREIGRLFGPAAWNGPDAERLIRAALAEAG